jgi:ABC-type Fe3+-siderophore transport system permease subunit
MSRSISSAWILIGLLVLGVVALLTLTACGATGTFGFGELLQGVGGLVGITEPLPAVDQGIIEIRFWRNLVALLVGGSLSLAGAYLQGLFRNPLASPSLLGVTGGAGFGATAAMLWIVPGSSIQIAQELGIASFLLVPTAALLGALLSMTVLLGIGFQLGRSSVTQLLLIGIALTSLWGGLTALVQNLALDRFDVSRAIVAWGLGSLDDRGPWHAGIVSSSLLLGILAIPFLGRALDLFAMGEADARTLGVHPGRIKFMTVLVTSILSAGAVAVAGQIAFIGLIIPNVVRVVLGSKHSRLLPASVLVGAVFLLGLDSFQRIFLPLWGLRPGVLLSLVGAPFFLFLLVRQRREVGPW